MEKKYRLILEALLRSQEPVTARELAQQVNCSERSIRNYAKAIQQELASYHAGLSAMPHRGYTLVCEEEARLRLQALYLDDGRETPAGSEEGRLLLEALLCALVDDEPVSQTELVEQAFLGLSTLKQRVKSLGEELSAYGLRVVSSRKGLSVSGGETALRGFLFEALSGRGRYPRLERKVFSDLSLSEISEVVDSVLGRYTLKLTDEAVRDFYLHLVIAQQRSSHQHEVFYNIGQVRELVDRVEYSMARDILWQIYEQYAVDMAAGELFYLTQRLIASKKYFEESSKVSRQHVGELVQKILQRVRSDFDIDFLADDCLQDGLALHMQVALSRMKFRMRVKNELLENIKTEYPMAFRLAITACRVIEEAEQITPDEDEIGFIAIHFGAALSRKGIQKTGKQKRIIIACTSGMGAALLLRSKLEAHFKDSIRIVQILPGYDITGQLLAEADYVLTTQPLPQVQSPKVICIQPLCTDEGMALLEKALFHKDIIETLHLDNLFQPQFFFVRDLDSKEAVLDFLTRKLLDKGYMTELTRTSVFEREKISSTAIGNLVALPHPLVNDQHKSAIAVLILRKPVQWDASRVQIIFLISIGKPLLPVWNTVAVNLYDYLVKKNGVKNLLRQASFSSFFEDFLKMFK